MSVVAGIVGNWDHVKWWMDRYEELRVDADEKTHVQLLFSDFLAWVRNQQPLSEMKEIDDGTQEHQG